MLRHFRPKTVENVKIRNFLQNVKKVTVTNLALLAPQLKKYLNKIPSQETCLHKGTLKKTSMVQGHCVSCDNILNTAYGAFFLLYVLLCGASSSCLSDLYLLQLQVQLFYDAEIRQNERVLSVSLRGNFEKIRIMTTFGSRVTQRGRQFEVRALYVF